MPPTTKPPLTLADVLEPLVESALRVSVLAHTWGIQDRCVESARAERVMGLTTAILDECRRMQGHPVLVRARTPADHADQNGLTDPTNPAQSPRP